MLKTYLISLLLLSNVNCRSFNEPIEIKLERRPKVGRADKQHLSALRKKRNLKEGEYDIEKDLANIYNYQYFGDLYVGTHLQRMTFIFDTGSSWTWLPNQDCNFSECP